MGRQDFRVIRWAMAQNMLRTTGLEDLEGIIGSTVKLSILYDECSKV